MGKRRAGHRRKDRLVRVPDRRAGTTLKQKEHERIAKVIRERITSGQLKPRRRIPSQAEMAEEFAVSGRTVAQAIAWLRDRGYVWTLPHKGSYTRPEEAWRE